MWVSCALSVFPLSDCATEGQRRVIRLLVLMFQNFKLYFFHIVHSMRCELNNKLFQHEQMQNSLYCVFYY